MAYGCTITVNAGQIPSSQSDFVWLATTNNFPVDAIDGGATSILNGGGNLRCYTDSTKSTPIPVEVVTFVTGLSPVVQVRGLSSTLNVASTVYIEADDTEFTQPPATDAYGRNSVWVAYTRSNNLAGASLTDSSGNQDLSVVSGSLSTRPSPFDGVVADFDGSTYLESVGAIASSEINITQSYWALRDTATEAAVFGSALNAGDSNEFGVRYDVIGFETGATQIYKGFVRSTGLEAQTNSSLLSTWQLLHLVKDGGTATLYIDGVAEVSNTVPNTDLIPSSTFIGRGVRSANIWNGGICEFTSRNESITADYVTSEYNNQSSPSTFWSTSAWTDSSGGGIELTPSNVNSSSLSINPSITFSSSLNLSPLQVDSSSLSINPTIEFSSALNLSPGEVNSLSISLDPTILFSGALELSPVNVNSVSISIDPTIQYSSSLTLAPNEVNTSSLAINPTIEYTSALVVAPQSVNSSSISINPQIEFKSIINLEPETVNSISIALNPIITTGEVQNIGNVTAGFKDSGISVKYSINNITVNFK